MPSSEIVLMSFIILLFLALGFLIKYKKCYWLISGYNIMSEEEKKNVDIVGLSKFMGDSLFVIAGILLIGSILDYFRIFLGFAISLGSIFVVVSYMLIGAQKYDNNTKRPDGKLKTSVIFIIGSIMLVFFVAVGSIIYGSMDNKVTINEKYIEIRGTYGVKLDMAEIKEISLVNTIPDVKRKTNGFNFGNILKGNFELNEIGIVKLYIYRGAAPYIYIKYGNTYVILNFKDSSKTQDLYSEMKKQWDKLER